MIRDGTRWRHPDEPIVPLLVLGPSGTTFSCLPCGRPLHFDGRHWRHYQHAIWRGVRR